MDDEELQNSVAEHATGRYDSMQNYMCIFVRCWSNNPNNANVLFQLLDVGIADTIYSFK